MRDNESFLQLKISRVFMLKKFALKFFIRFVSFVFLFSLGVLSFNLFHINERLQMLRVVNEFHIAQVNNNKTVINNLLADNFTESGVKLAVTTPDNIYKSDLVNYDYSKIDIKSIEAKYPVIFNMFSNSNTSLSFVREVNWANDNNSPLPSFSFYVTYTFEKRADGLKIVKIERKL
jgi:hypothetical protein